MPTYDMPFDQSKTYLPTRNEPADFDAFWQATLEEARRYTLFRN
ncbi:MAG: acetylxylan esterase [Anaerolineae bacterium]